MFCDWVFGISLVNVTNLPKKLADYIFPVSSVSVILKSTGLGAAYSSQHTR